MEHSKNDEGIKGGSSGICLADANSNPCLQFVYQRRESVSARLLISKTQNNPQNDTALVSTAGESTAYRHTQSRGNNAMETVFNLQLT